ncbi:MAG: OmpA family protein [Alphaproteobacteria bacterium]
MTTAPVGPTARPSPPPGPVKAEARPLSAPVQTASALTGPRSLRDFDASRSGLSYRAAVIYHSRGSAALSKKAVAQLSEVASLYKQGGGTLRIIGHASSQTRDMNLVSHRLINFKLSLDRANTAAKRLAALGVDPGAMFVGAVSDNQPVYYEVMPAGEAANRRTEIYIDQ